MVKECGGFCKGYVVDISKKEEVYQAANVITHEIGDVSIIIFLKIKKHAFLFLIMTAIWLLHLTCRWYYYCCF